MRTTRTLAAMLLTLLVAGFGVAGTASPAQAADFAKFWMYFHVEDAEYVVYEVGVGGTTPADGGIEAFRYGTSEDFPPHIAPRADLGELTFEAICGHVDPVAGEKRLGVIIDFGVPEDSDGDEPPAGYAACAQVAEDATGLQVLDAVSEVRAETSDFGPSLCGVDGYPAAGPCFGTDNEVSPDDAATVAFPVAGVDAEAGSDSDDDEDSNWPLLAGAGALLLALAGGGVFLARRNGAA